MTRSPAAPCACFIIPPDVLRRFGRDPDVDAPTRDALRATLLDGARMRSMREAWRVAGPTASRPALGQPVEAMAQQYLFDCGHRRYLPGRPVLRLDNEFRQVSDTTARLIRFYREVLGRNSFDDQGGDLVSSLHYGERFDNAFWNGHQMVYGDGDGKLFQAMYAAPDVIAHEVAHGVTQDEAALRYEGESGALNESLSDVTGAVFNQWSNGWTVEESPGWLIGAGILADGMRSRGYTCLRDMVTPDAAHCVSPQPAHFDAIDPSADVHLNSGVPNRAFVLFARSLGGRAWEEALPVWYRASISRQLRSDATFAEFAALTVVAARARGTASMAQRCRAAWRAVGVNPEQLR